jgi:hypothetical protein
VWSGPTGGAIFLGRIGVWEMPLGRSRSAVGTLPRSRARAYGARKRGQRRKVFCLASLLCEYPWSCRRFFFFLRQVIPYGAAHFDKIALLTTTQHNTPTNRRKPSAAEKGGSEVSHDHGNPTRTHAKEGQAERSGQAGRTQRRREVRGSPPTTAIQLARTPKKTKPSVTARPNAAEKRGSGFSPD